MKKQTTHTPTPWTYEITEDGACLILDSTNSQNVIMSQEPARGNVPYFGIEANAAYIVRAVNSHEDLIASMKEAIQSIENGAGIYAAGFLKDAIAKVEGK